MKFLKNVDVPRWYSLYWDFEKSGLFIKIHTFFLEHTEFKNWEPYFSDVETRFSYEPLFDSYVPNLGRERFGLNNSITLVHSNENWLTYKIGLPSVNLITGRACPKCEATGKRYPEDTKSDEICMYCDGTKNESLLVFREIRMVCYSLRILLTALSIQLEIDIPTSEFQLFTIESSTGVGPHAHSVGGYMSPKMISFLETFSDSYDKRIHLPEIEKVMSLAHQQIHGEIKDYDKRSFRCYTRGGQIVLSCPGDACEIHNEINRAPLDGMGNDILCHNLDNPIQQLTLLSGLSALSTMFDRQK